MNLRYPTQASWKTIDLYVQHDHQKNSLFWEKIDVRPFTCGSLDQLITLGLQVEFLKLEGAYGYARSQDKETIPRKYANIQIHNLLRPYNRDKTIFHELMHVWHGYSLDDGFDKKEHVQKINTIRVEWLSRQARADAELLRHTLTRLRIKPWIYDKASYDAFQTQCENPGRKEDYYPTRMD
ncbi:MAG: ImmA/IrrE family metallo-endopeptidase [bacterium]|nr:ImmA/IrrE family metallo-endopeptidase [bacterium]